jgi:hypothetical protein
LLKRMLELVIRQRLNLAVVALSDRLEKRLVGAVAGKSLLDDRPGDRPGDLVGPELVAYRGRPGRSGETLRPPRARGDGMAKR